MSHLAMKDELKACPFCGGEATLRKHPGDIYGGGHRYESLSIGCSNHCVRFSGDVQDWSPKRGIFYKDKETRDRITTRWNTRTPDKDFAFEWFKLGENMTGSDYECKNETELRELFEVLWECPK